MSATIVTRCEECRRFGSPDRDRCKCGATVKSRKVKDYHIDLQGDDNPRSWTTRTRIHVGRSTNKVAALARREQLLTAITTGRYVRDDQSRKLTLGKLRDWYLARAEMKLLRSYDIAKIQMANIVAGIGEHVIVAAMGEGDIEAYRNLRRGLNIAPATINKEVGQLVAALNAAKRAKRDGKVMLHQNPIAGMKKLPENNARDFTVDLPEFERAIALCRKIVPDGDLWLAPMVEVAFFTMQREGELIGLTDDRMVFDDDGADYIKLRAVDTKNGKPRVVRMHPRVKKELQRLLRLNKLRGRGLVFRRATGKPVSAKTLQKTWRKVVEQLKLHHADYGYLHFHDIRHCGAEYYQSLGSHDRAIMSMGGWLTMEAFKRYPSKNQLKHQAGIVWDRPEKPKKRRTGHTHR
jgi:integrase